MRILLYSNPIWGKTGYSSAAKHLLTHLNNLGHEVAMFVNYGLKGGAISADGMVFYPTYIDVWGNDLMQAHANDFRADLIITIYDAWPLKFEKFTTPTAAWAPIDHQPAPDDVLKALTHANWPISFSEFGQGELVKAGLKDARFIPLGVDCEVYKPLPQAEARDRLGLPQGKFIVGMVGTNVTYPTRKCIPQVLAAFQRFNECYPDSLLYLHTEETGQQGKGIKVSSLLNNLNLGPDKVRLCDQYHNAIGFPESYMVDVYNAIDLLAQPSMSEGFGLPIIEAQACGTLVLTNDCTSMTELLAGGWLITDYERWWSQQMAWQVIPHEKAIIEAFEDAYRLKHGHEREPDGGEWTKRKTTARQYTVAGYDFKTQIAPRWTQFLTEIEPELAIPVKA